MASSYVLPWTDTLKPSVSFFVSFFQVTMLCLATVKLAVVSAISQGHSTNPGQPDVPA